MKLFYKILAVTSIVAAAISFVGCKDDFYSSIDNKMDNDVVSNGIVYPNSKNFKATRAGSFETDWENYRIIPIAGSSLIAPWASNAPGNFSYKMATDIKKEDGWKLLSHTFNLNDDTTRKHHHMTFYNIKTGDLKYFYYMRETPAQHSSSIWQVNFLQRQGIMNSSETLALPCSHQYQGESDFRWTSTIEENLSHSSKITEGWNLLYIPNLVYDPNCDPNLVIKIKTNALKTYYGTIFGTADGEMNGKIITYNGSNPFSDTKNTVANLTGESSKNFINDLLSKGKGNYKDGQTETKAFDWLSIAAGGIGKLAELGANFIFDKLIGPFNRTDSTVTEIRLTSHSDINLKVDMSSSTTDGGIETRFEIGKNYTGLELGTWNITENPTIYIHPVGVISEAPAGLSSADNSYSFKASGKYNVNVVFNPTLVPYIKKYSVSCVPVRYWANSQKKDYIPHSSIVLNDKGSLGVTDDVRMSYDSKDPYYQDDNIIIFKNDCQGAATYHGLWNKYGKYNGKIPIYKYIYGPTNNELKYGGAIGFGTATNLVKVTVQMEVEFEGKTETIIDTRTYAPKFEWDPDMVRRYGSISMEYLQGATYGDRILEELDNGTYDRLLRMANL